MKLSIRKSIILIFFILISSKSQAQDYQKLDSSLVNRMNMFYEENVTKYKAAIMDSLEAIYARDNTAFNDKNGKKSIVLIINKVQELLLPLRQELYKEVAKTVLTQSEYDYFLKLKFQISRNTGIPVLTLQNAIYYDAEWISNLYIKTSLLFQNDFSSYEYLYYLTSYEISGIIEPKYMTEILSNNSFIHSDMESSAMQMVFDFFILMHEFYHAYYEQRLSISSHNEIDADMFAINKWANYTNQNDSDSFVNDSIFASIRQLFFKPEFEEKMDPVFKRCKTSRYFNDSVTMRALNISYIGLHITNILLYEHSRYFLTGLDQLEADIVRSEKFIQLALDSLKCNNNENTISCCRINREKKRNEEFKNLIDRLAQADFYNQKIDTALYKEISIDEPSFIPFFLGNYHLKTQNYARAIEYYESANLLAQKSELTVLCNLFCYEIYNSIYSLQNRSFAKRYLDIAKDLNEKFPALRKVIVESLE